MRVYTPELAARLVALSGLELLERERRPGGGVDENEIDLIVRRPAAAPSSRPASSPLSPSHRSS
jgi:hypothetical protein